MSTDCIQEDSTFSLDPFRTMVAFAMLEVPGLNNSLGGFSHTQPSPRSAEKLVRHSPSLKFKSSTTPVITKLNHEDSLIRPGPQCTQLTIQQKYEVLLQIDQNIPYREIAKVFNIAQSTITGIKKSKREILSLINKEHGVNLSMHRIHKSMGMINKVLDEKIYEWFVERKNDSVLVTGKQIQEKALEIAEQLQLADFKASNGWLDSFKRRHNIVLKQKY